MTEEIKEEVKVEAENESENKEKVLNKKDDFTNTQTYGHDSRKPYRDNRDNKKDFKKDYRNSGDKDDYKFRKMRRKVCLLCKEENYVLDYKDADTIRRFINEKGKILPRRATGTCAKHQREIAKVIKRSRHIAVLPYVIE